MSTDSVTTSTNEPWARPTGIGHVRLTVSDIARSKAFYTALLGTEPFADFSDQADEDVSTDPGRFYGGCVFRLGNQLLGLRPVASAGDRFDSTRTGLDHVSLLVGSGEELRQTADRLDQAGVSHGEVIDLSNAGMMILSVQDPDDINLELSVVTG